MTAEDTITELAALRARHAELDAELAAELAESTTLSEALRVRAQAPLTEILLEPVAFIDAGWHLNRLCDCSAVTTMLPAQLCAYASRPNSCKAPSYESAVVLCMWHLDAIPLRRWRSGWRERRHTREQLTIARDILWWRWRNAMLELATEMDKHAAIGVELQAKYAYPPPPDTGDNS